jgi:MerR family transcriptional regulator/heat shock protein HspR
MTGVLAPAPGAPPPPPAAVHQSYRRDLVPVDRRQALVVWRPDQHD